MVALWVIFALSFAFFHALVAVFDKIVLKNKSIGPVSFATLRYGLNALFSLVIVSLFFTFSMPSEDILFSILLLSLVYVGAGFFYFIPLKMGDVSQLVPLREAITVLFSFVLATILLLEKISVLDFVGTLVIIFGSYILLTDGKLIAPKLSKPMAFNGILGLLLAIFGVFSKPLTLVIHPAMLNFYLYIIVFLFFLLGNSKMNYRNQMNTFGTIFNNRRLLVLSLGSSLSAAIGTLSLFYGLTLGQAAEVLPVSRVLPVFAVLISWIVLKEKSGMARLMGALVTFVGVYLVAS